MSGLFGNGSDEQTVEQTPQKYAILLNAGPDDTPTAGNAFNYVLELNDAGYEARLFLDGHAAKWPGEFLDNPERPYNADWERIQQNGLLAGVCGACANAFDATEACDMAGINMLSDGGKHAPSLPELVEDNYEILTV